MPSTVLPFLNVCHEQQKARSQRAGLSSLAGLLPCSVSLVSFSTCHSPVPVYFQVKSLTDLPSTGSVITRHSQAMTGLQFPEFLVSWGRVGWAQRDRQCEWTVRDQKRILNACSCG